MRTPGGLYVYELSLSQLEEDKMVVVFVERSSDSWAR